MRFKVFSGRTEAIEAGYTPHLEAVFRTHKEAEDYAQSWRNFYPSGSPDFWVTE